MNRSNNFQLVYNAKCQVEVAAWLLLEMLAMLGQEGMFLAYRLVLGKYKDTRANWTNQETTVDPLEKY